MKYLLLIIALLLVGCAEQESDKELQLIISSGNAWQAIAYPSFDVYNGTGNSHFFINAESDSVIVSMVKGNSWRLMAYTSFPPSETAYCYKPYGSVTVYPTR